MVYGGTLNGHRIVTEQWVTRATQPNTSANEKAYGFQWWLNAGDDQLRFPDLPSEAFIANGNRQQIVMVVPSQESVILRLGWTEGSYPVNDRFREILSKLSDGKNYAPLASLPGLDGLLNRQVALGNKVYHHLG